jgi:hypothetical protein
MLVNKRTSLSTSMPFSVTSADIFLCFDNIPYTIVSPLGSCDGSLPGTIYILSNIFISLNILYISVTLDSFEPKTKKTLTQSCSKCSMKIILQLKSKSE